MSLQSHPKHTKRSQTFIFSNGWELAETLGYMHPFIGQILRFSINYDSKSAVRQTLQIQISPFPEERWFSKKSWVWTNVEIQLLVYSRRFRKYFGDHGWKRLKKAVENIKQIWWFCFHLFLYMYVAFRKPLLTV